MKRVQEVVQRVYDNGHVYEGTYEGWYCPRCADFKTESEIEDGNRCPIHKIELTREKEKNWFFKLSAFQETLEKLYEERPDFVTPDFRRNEALAFIKQGLQDVSLSRPSLKWGVPVPWDPDQVIYVWFDALLNYYTALGYAREGEDLTERFWPAFHILAKDILKFHAVYWPAFLMAAGIEVPKGDVHPRLPADGGPQDVEVARQRARPRRGDRQVRRRRAALLLLPRGLLRPGRPDLARGFETRYETELANEYGNLANRTLSMIGRYRDGAVPEAEAEAELAGAFEGALGRVSELLDALRADPGAGGDLEAGAPAEPVRRGDPALGPGQGGLEADRLDAVLYGLAEGLRVTTLLLHAYMPETTGKLLDALGEPGRELAEFGSRGGGQTLGELAPLFPKLEPAEIRFIAAESREDDQ